MRARPRRLDEIDPDGPSHEGVLGFSSLAGLLARVSSAGERLPTSSSLAVALLPFDVDPYSGGAAPELHRVPFLDSAAREDATAEYQAWLCRRSVRSEETIGQVGHRSPARCP
jgi:hypothetical protein